VPFFFFVVVVVKSSTRDCGHPPSRRQRASQVAFFDPIRPKKEKSLGHDSVEAVAAAAAVTEKKINGNPSSSLRGLIRMAERLNSWLSSRRRRRRHVLLLLLLLLLLLMLLMLMMMMRRRRRRRGAREGIEDGGPHLLTEQRQLLPTTTVRGVEGQLPPSFHPPAQKQATKGHFTGATGKGGWHGTRRGLGLDREHVKGWMGGLGWVWARGRRSACLKREVHE
jgi:hypothetical protein